jgi:hypothetical protein
MMGAVEVVVVAEEAEAEEEGARTTEVSFVPMEPS